MESVILVDCETTTDILGPFYRPDAPERTNLLIPGMKGQEVVLKGIVKHKDCITPYKGAKVELWHCDSDGKYDNTSSDYKHRATTFCDAQGHYEFLTLLPVPYDNNGDMRPAHFHLMISSPGYQSLVTQLYFSGDPYLHSDTYASTSAAKSRYLSIKSNTDGRKLVEFDVYMTDKLLVEPAVIDRLVGTYMDVNDKTQTTEFFKRDGQLWRKAGWLVFGLNYDYVGDNTFVQSGLSPELVNNCKFEIQQDGSIKMTRTYVDTKGNKTVNVAIKPK
jgi:catechol 1,2-dioxygenase